MLDPYGSTGTPVEEELLRSRNSPHTIYIGACRSMVHALALWLSLLVRDQFSGGIGVAQGRYLAGIYTVLLAHTDSWKEFYLYEAYADSFSLRSSHCSLWPPPAPPRRLSPYLTAIPAARANSYFINERKSENHEPPQTLTRCLRRIAACRLRR